MAVPLHAWGSQRRRVRLLLAGCPARRPRSIPCDSMPRSIPCATMPPLAARLQPTLCRPAAAGAAACSVPHHSVIVTKAFEPQQRLLSVGDIGALWRWCVPCAVCPPSHRHVAPHWHRHWQAVAPSASQPLLPLPPLPLSRFPAAVLRLQRQRHRRRGLLQLRRPQRRLPAPPPHAVHPLRVTGKDVPCQWWCRGCQWGGHQQRQHPGPRLHHHHHHHLAAVGAGCGLEWGRDGAGHRQRRARHLLHWQPAGPRHRHTSGRGGPFSTPRRRLRAHAWGAVHAR